MKLRLQPLAVFFTVAAIASALQFTLFTGQAQQESCGAVHPNVLLELQTNPEVSVVISLQAAADPYAVGSMEEAKQVTAEQQASVLADLTPADFTIISQYSFTPALAGLG